MSKAELTLRHPPNREIAVSTHDHVAAALAKDILTGTYPPGSKIPVEAEILERFGISRTLLREVLKTLAAKGLVVSRTRVGTKVLDSAHWNFFDSDLLTWKVSLGLDTQFRRDLAEIRLAIEPRAAALAAKRRSPEALAELHNCIARMRSATQSRREFAEADLAFHKALVAGSGNVLMRSISAVIETALVASFTLSSPVRDRKTHKSVVDGHERIVLAIAAGDATAAGQATSLVIDASMPREARAKPGVPTQAE